MENHTLINEDWEFLPTLTNMTLEQILGPIEKKVDVLAFIKDHDIKPLERPEMFDRYAVDAIGGIYVAYHRHGNIAFSNDPREYIMLFLPYNIKLKASTVE